MQKRMMISTIRVWAAACAMSAIMGGSAQAGLIAGESFDYTDGATLGTQTGGTGWATTWKSNPTLTTDSALTVSGTNLAAPGNSVTPSGGSVTLPSGLIARQLSTPIDLNTDQDYYVSILTHRGSGNSFNAGFYNDTGTTQSAIFGHSSSGSAKAYVGGIGVTTAGSTVIAAGSSKLWIFKIAAKSGAGLDQAFVKLYDSSTSIDRIEPTTWDATGVATASNIVLDRFFASTNSGAASEGVDEIRIGTTFADVVPEPASLAFSAIGGVLLLRRKRKGH